MGANNTSYIAAPTTAVITTYPAAANSACGGGYVAIAGTNFTGSNFQMYAVDDFSSTSVLIEGTSY